MGNKAKGKGPTPPHPSTKLTLGQVAKKYSKFGDPLADLLVREDQASAQRLHNALLQWGPVLAGLNEFAEQFLYWGSDPDLDPDIAGLLRQASDRVKAGVQAIIQTTGPRTVDDARFLMEVEFLLHEFAARPEQLAKWRDAPPHLRNNTFGYGKLRANRERDLGFPKAEVVPDRDEYAAHSQLVHPRPASEIVTNDEAKAMQQTMLAADLIDLFQHADRVYRAALNALPHFATNTGATPAAGRPLNVDTGQHAIDVIEEWVASTRIGPRPDRIGLKRDPLESLRPDLHP